MTVGWGKLPCHACLSEADEVAHELHLARVVPDVRCDHPAGAGGLGHLNVPPAILGRGGVAYAITQAGLMDVAPQLVLEVTEQDIPDKLGIQALRLARRYGIHVALDDVGVADEHLAVFARVPVDILKIDKSLVDQLRDEDELPPWLKALSALLPVTPLQVIVEGVEQEGQVTKLKAARIQGKRIEVTL